MSAHLALALLALGPQASRPRLAPLLGIAAPPPPPEPAAPPADRGDVTAAIADLAAEFRETTRER